MYIIAHTCCVVESRQEARSPRSQHATIWSVTLLQLVRGNMAACSAAPPPFYRLSQQEQDVDDEEIIPPRAPVQCSDAWSSLCCNCTGNMELSAARSTLLARLPSSEENIPLRAPVPCSDAWSSLCSNSRNMELFAAACLEIPFPSQQNLRHVADEEMVCLRAPVRCSEDLSDEQFVESSIEEINFDEGKTELVCSTSNG